jgi:hypothetical protein
MNTPADFAEDLAEIIELKLLGMDTIGSYSWNDYAVSLLDAYRKASSSDIKPYVPLWRSLYQAYKTVEPGMPVYVPFSRIITAFCDRIESDFPLQEVDRAILLSFLRRESELALQCE